MAKSILIVDDSPLMRKIIRKSFSKIMEDWAYYEAGNGVEGLEQLKANQIHLIFSDINMPVMNGLDFVSKVRAIKEYQRIPIIMVTSEGNEEYLDLAARLGATGYIQKPFTPQKLQTLINSLKSA